MRRRWEGEDRFCNQSRAVKIVLDLVLSLKREERKTGRQVKEDFQNQKKYRQKSLGDYFSGGGLKTRRGSPVHNRPLTNKLLQFVKKKKYN